MTEQIAVDNRVDNGAEAATDDAVVERIEQRLREQGLSDSVGVNRGLHHSPAGLSGIDGMVEDIARRVVHAGDYEVKINTGRYGEEAHPDEIRERGSVAAVRQDRGFAPLARPAVSPGVVHADTVAAPGTPAQVVEPHARPQSPEEAQAALRARVQAFRADRVLDPAAGDEPVSIVPVTGTPQVDSAGNLIADRVVGGPAPVLATSDSAARAEAQEREAARLAQQQPHPMVEAVGAQQVPHRPAALDAAAAELSAELPETSDDAEIDASGHVRSRSKRGRRARAEAEPEPAPETLAPVREPEEPALEDGMFPDGQPPAETEGQSA